MQSFRLGDKVFPIALTIGACKRAKALAGVDLLSPGDGDPPLHIRLALDDALLADTCYALMKPDLDAAGLTDEAFGCQLTGEAFQAMSDAFWIAYANFFAQRGRPDIVTILTKQTALIRARITLATEHAAAIATPG